MNNKRDTRRDAWDRDYLPYKEIDKVEPPKKDYTIWFFAFFFISVLVMIGGKSWFDCGDIGARLWVVVHTMIIRKMTIYTWQWGLFGLYYT